MRIAAALFACLPITVQAQSAPEEALIREVFATLNLSSIKANREYCGYLGFTADGVLAVSDPTLGDEGSCLSDDPVNLDLIIASYHTHGAYSEDYYNEVPSGTDMEGDEDEGIDGWVATPGGRLWYIDTADMTARQICGIGCLPSDPDFVPGDMGLIAQGYSYADLIQKLEE